MRALVSFPGNFMDAQQAARAFYERDALARFVTGIAFDERSLCLRLAARVPGPAGERLRAELRRRLITEVPRRAVASYPWLEALRTGLARYAANPVHADLVWDFASHRFDRTVARRHLDAIDLVHAFEYTAHATFEEAGRRGIGRVLALPSLDNREFERIRTREEAQYPELRSFHHRHFADRFARRQARRSAEIALADVIVANSELTRRSHIAGGADPAKIVVVPLAAPPPIAGVAKPAADADRPLTVVWAGTMSIRKGAHYFFEAWRTLRAGDRARARVYGQPALPQRILNPLPTGIEWIGSRPQPELFAAFEEADVLVFPTLSDGFGMVVAEAFSRGLPVIATDRAGAADLVEHGHNGLLIPAADAGALAEALRWCIDNRRALYQMRFAALATARRWQWPDYRRLLIAGIDAGLRRAGFSPNLPTAPVEPGGSRDA